jgi:hypothetical protein
LTSALSQAVVCGFSRASQGFTKSNILLCKVEG